MIYRNNYLKEELKKSYLSGKGGGVRLLIVTVGIALFSVLLNSCMSILSSTIIGDLLSLFCSKSFFSVISSMNFIILIFFVFYLSEHYFHFTFAEINKNRWYMLRKTGYSTFHIVAVKQLTSLLMAAVIYSCSFLFLTFFCIIFQYQMLLSSLLSLAIVGFIKVLFLIEVVITASFFSTKKTVGLCVGLLTVLFIFILENATGFFNFISLPINLQVTKLLFVGKRAIFTYFMIVGYFVLLGISSLISAKKADYYSIPETSRNDIFIIDYKTNRTISSKVSKNNRFNSIIRIAVTSAFCLVMLFVLAANVLIVAIGSNKNEVFTFKGYVPLLFSSETMPGEIEKNDFAVFKNVDKTYKFKEGDIVLYYKNSVANIKRIEQIEADGTIIADIISYPNQSDYGAALERTDGSNFESVLVYTNRWLGAWLVWNNSVIGRIISLAIPILIIVFYNKIALFFTKFRDIFGFETED